MPTEEASGSQLATGGEDTLATIAVNRSLILTVDLSIMADGTRVILRGYRRVLAAGVDRVVFKKAFVGTQPERNRIVQMVPLSSPHQALFTLEQPAGGLATFDWSVESL